MEGGIYASDGAYGRHTISLFTFLLIEFFGVALVVV